MDAPKLSWAIDTSTIPAGPATFSYEADEAERAILKAYAGVESITSFSASVRVKPLSGGRFKAEGHLEAHLIQESVVSLKPVESQLREEFSVEYWPDAAIEKEEKHLSPDEDVPEVLAEGVIPIGALLSELLALAVDPYPRNEGESFEWTAPAQEKEASPFAALDRLRQPKNNGEA
jgi:uncharacterized metal-binding protein YceD (DUF177 family)